MIKWNELRVTQDGKELIIDGSVKDLEYYKDVYIEEVVIDSQDTYVPNGPSSKPIFSYNVESETEKSIRLELDSKALGVTINNTMFFVYIVVKGTPSIDTPCGMDNQITLGVVANLCPFHQHMVAYMKEIENTCDIPSNFINSILQYKALELSVRTGHYTQAIKYWNKFFQNIQNATINTGCKCHG